MGQEKSTRGYNLFILGLGRVLKAMFFFGVLPFTLGKKRERYGHPAVDKSTSISYKCNKKSQYSACSFHTVWFLSKEILQKIHDPFEVIQHFLMVQDSTM